MPFCAIKWCGKRSATSNYSTDGITFHRFPKRAEIKEAWINASSKDNWFPTNNSVICSTHFTSDCFEQLKNNRRRLFQTAIPTLYLPGLISPQLPNADIVNQDQKSATDVESEDAAIQVKPETEHKTTQTEVQEDNENDDSPIKVGTVEIYKDSAYDTTGTAPGSSNDNMGFQSDTNEITIEEIKIERVKDQERKRPGNDDEDSLLINIPSKKIKSFDSSEMTIKQESRDVNNIATVGNYDVMTNAEIKTFLDNINDLVHSINRIPRKVAFELQHKLKELLNK